METGNVKFNRGIYFRNIINPVSNFFTYELEKSPQVENKFITPIVRIEKDNGFHDRSRFFEYWLYFRNDKNWKRCNKTGLAQTNFKNLFEGNISRVLNLSTKNIKGKNFETEQHLILLYQLNGFEKIIIDVFENFYIHDKGLLKVFINEHFYKHGLIKYSECYGSEQ